ncbi:zinc-binding alcohol dehydrogenase [Bacillus sp. FJAT-42376]|uniref:zinc-binding dehydrogenase n=1 Tax=Bacillus sp. FJAT-42376 TaxID=2014076 RepID=UPI000F4FED67|nr:zinc-binding dehydrogenase [Bacillus sp. FJAT-42376]AZB44164.1 zinc-binding alcohol dehydrogenase [Bacillus sp. FJAT-42376]
MKALLLEAKGKWDQMKVGSIPAPSPQKGEILVRVHAVGLNPVDYKTATNGNPTWNYPHILGLDVAGTIEELGEGVTQWKKGDRVVYHGDMTKGGGFAEYAVTTAHTVSQIPEGVSFKDAAALPTAGYTAYEALFRKLPLHTFKTILIQGGAGGVGGFAIQLAKNAGLEVFTTASASNHEYVKSLGADHVIDYRSEDVKEKVLELTNGRGVDAVLDTVSRQTSTDALEYIAYRGQLAHIAGAPDTSEVKPFTKVISFHEVALGAIHKADFESQKDLAAMGDEMLELLKAGKIESLLSETISLEEIPEALVRLSERHVKGKIVAEIAE